MKSSDADEGHVPHGPIERLKAWWRTERMRQELRTLPESVFDGIRQDTGFSRYDAEHIVADHPGPDHLMPERLAAAGIDAARIEGEQPLLYRDMAATCAKCGSYRKCEREINAGGSPEGKWEYCLNNGNIEALKAAEKSCCKG